MGFRHLALLNIPAFHLANWKKLYTLYSICCLWDSSGSGSSWSGNSALKGASVEPNMEVCALGVFGLVSNTVIV